MTIIVGTGGRAFANKNCPQGRLFEQFFQLPGVCPGVCPGGILAAGIDSHIISSSNMFVFLLDNLMSDGTKLITHKVTLRRYSNRHKTKLVAEISLTTCSTTYN